MSNMLNKIIIAHFSPTGGTRKASLCMAQGMAEFVEEIDFSLPTVENHAFESIDVVIFAVPVFGGRIPDFCIKHIKACYGNSAKAITVAVYGGREYDDALSELNDYIEEQGFDIVGSAALLAQHSMYPLLAVGRPDLQDQEEIQKFAGMILGKIEQNTESLVLAATNRPYCEWKPLPILPAVSDECNHCGLCATKCPAQAICEGKEHLTSPECILCMRCVSICPKKARALPKQVQKMLEQKLSTCLSIRKENRLFL